MSSTPVPILPDDIILEIFKRLPLQDLFNGIRPIRCWRLILQRELNRRHTLLLYSYISKLSWDYPHCTLPNEAQAMQSCIKIFEAVKATMVHNPLPNITNLFIQKADVNKEQLKNIIRCIRLWSPKLTTLRLDISFEFNIWRYRKAKKILRDFKTMILDLFDTLNHIPTLRHLYLNLDCFFTIEFESVSLPDNLTFAFLSHLHTFCFKTSATIDESNERLLASLREHAIGNEHLQICLHDAVSMEELLELGPQLSRKFAQIETDLYEERLIQPFCAQFSSLTRLTLHCEPYMMAALSKHLRLLSNLFNLKLKFDNAPIFERPDQDEEDEEDEPAVDEPEQYYQITSVRVLRLRIESKSHTNIGALHIAHIFPNLQVVRFWNKSQVCSQCSYIIRSHREYDENEKFRNKIAECKRLARQTFGACAKLRTMEYDDDPVNHVRKK